MTPPRHPDDEEGAAMQAEKRIVMTIMDWMYAQSEKLVDRPAPSTAELIRRGRTAEAYQNARDILGSMPLAVISAAVRDREARP